MNIGTTNKLKKRLTNQPGGRYMTDMINLIEGKTVPYDFSVNGIKVHKVILMARNEYFRRMLASGFKESSMDKIDIPNVDQYILENFIRFLYVDELNKDFDFVQHGMEMARVADYLQQKDLANMVLNVVEREVQQTLLSLDNTKDVEKTIFAILEYSELINESFEQMLLDFLIRLGYPCGENLNFELTDDLQNKIINMMHKSYMKW